MRRPIRLWLDLFIYRRFASLCKFLGINVCDALENFMKDFIERHKDQAPLDLYLNQGDGKTQIINLSFTQNNYNIILAKIAKLDPQRWLDWLNDIDPDRLDPQQAAHWKETLPELILQASKTIEEIKASGEGLEYIETLQELIRKASELLKQLLKQKPRRDLIHG